MSVLAAVDSLTVDVITDNMSDTYASKPPLRPRRWPTS